MQPTLHMSNAWQGISLLQPLGPSLPSHLRISTPRHQHLRGSVPPRRHVLREEGRLPLAHVRMALNTGFRAHLIVSWTKSPGQPEVTDL
eukprot:748481-Hanusia_phi.AAC.2